MVTVTDSQGSQYKDSTIVNVMNTDDMDGMFKMIWKRTKTALANKDVGAALTDIYSYQRGTYQKVFGLIQETLPIMSENMKEIYMMDIGNDIAEYKVALSSDYGGADAYYIEFVRDTGGVWRLSFF